MAKKSVGKKKPKSGSKPHKSTCGYTIKDITKKYPLVRIVWEDAHSSAGGWRDANDVKDFIKDPNCIIHDVGYLIEKTKRHILITNRITNGDNNVCFGHLMKIPRTWCKIEKLKTK